jgi:hypothetical protein
MELTLVKLGRPTGKTKGIGTVSFMGRDLGSTIKSDTKQGKNT